MSEKNGQSEEDPQDKSLSIPEKELRASEDEPDIDEEEETIRIPRQVALPPAGEGSHGGGVAFAGMFLWLLSQNWPVLSSVPPLRVIVTDGNTLGYYTVNNINDIKYCEIW